MNSEFGAIVDEKIKTAITMSKERGNLIASPWWKSVLESKAIQELGPVVDAKQYRQWNKKMKNALEQVRPNARKAFEAVEQFPEEELIDVKQKGTTCTQDHKQRHVCRTQHPEHRHVGAPQRES